MPVAISDLPSEIDVVGLVIGRKATFEVPPPGGGLTTVIQAVLAVAMSDDRTVAVNRILDT
jgi:hypothetical protein